ncbi:MAG TPA: PilZ domain-containing protein [Spirochaetota bacterium]|nr:PilZ domain-containing protein [Spirochaetota bacterium]HOM39037.1 PilZ domain-containing protein [Spirochaetota bacterium]HPQ49910.1 PilZ domain-containing protein [Spirochaetota bacterium]
MLEQRSSDRYRVIWKVYLKTDTKYKFIGFLMDISQGGARFFIEKISEFRPEKESEFTVLIKPQEDLKIKELVIKVKCKWYKEWSSDSDTYELGVEFVKTDPGENNIISNFIEEFKKLKR